MAAPLSLPRRSVVGRWLFRPQFSLRSLFVAFTGFAVGFAVWYQWPYEETRIPSREMTTDPYCGQRSFKDKDGKYSRVTQSWQRQWGGGRLAHGWCRKYDANGQLCEELQFRRGVRHGIYRSYFLGKLDEEGQLANGQREGFWTFWFGRNWSERGPMRHGKRQGEWVFRSAEDDTLARFDEDRVVAINGEPVDRMFEKQIAGINRANNEDYPLLLQTGIFYAFDQPLREVIENREGDYGVPLFLDHCVNGDLQIDGSWKDLRLPDWLLLVCQPRGLTVVRRYGGICVTSRLNSDSWIDPTQVSKLDADAESLLSGALNERVDLNIFYDISAAELLVEICSRLGVDVDVSRIEPSLDEPDRYRVKADITEHPFRDVLGYLLYKIKCRCELDGEKLVIVPEKG